MPLSVVVISVAWAVSLTGCASPGHTAEGGTVTVEQVKASAEHYKAEGYERMASLLEDGIVDSEDYDSAADMYVTCLRELGYAPGAPQLNPTNSLTYIFDVQAAGRDAEQAAVDEDECRVPNLSVVEAIYLNTNQQRIDESVRLASLKCMARAGYDVDGSARDIRGFSGTPESDDGAQRSAAATCITEAALELFPDLPYVGIGY